MDGNFFANDGVHFNNLMQAKLNRAATLDSIAGEMGYDSTDWINLDKRLIKVTPIWYICVVNGSVWQIYGLDSGSWVVEYRNGFMFGTQMADSKDALFEALGIEGDE